MFTGLVEQVGRIRALKSRGDGLSLEIEASKILQDVKIGDSIAVDGACLTVVAVNGVRFSVDAVAETVKRTTLGEKKTGSPVNLERAMSANGRFGGHFVQGHVDGLGKIIAIEPRAVGYRLDVQLPEQLSSFVIEKGSIAIDGLSLTIAAIEGNNISIAVIPHTWASTTLSGKKVGDKVNIEVDMLAKYIHKILKPYNNSSDITFDKLAELGFE